ncbi:hypothetical protein B9Z19DRAFT_405616 [Tuber borchii]|uniref:Uncharacterized protein n=1 Tax=Tuber borchii TaxID=42251 RepID=A0A2T6ZH20_TUBBO|nr:hypothetical protein B9Z19DRAFT_405616 [Tuber borchii]
MLRLENSRAIARRVFVLSRWQYKRDHSSGQRVQPSFSAALAPAFLRVLDNFEGYRSSAASGNKLGVNDFLKQYARYPDPRPFLAKYQPKAQGANFMFLLSNGSLNA